MNKYIFALAATILAFGSCVNDDKYTWDDFSDKTSTDTITIGITFQEQSVVVEGDLYGFVNSNGAHVTVNSSTNKFLQLVLRGESSNGSLLINSWKAHGVLLNGLNLTNPNGPAINNQCSKAFYVTNAEGAINTLTDGTTYAEAPLNAKGESIDQKATLFSEGQIYFNGTGTLNINGNAKNAVASDDYITINNSTLNIKVSTTGSNGIKANDGVFIKGGNIDIEVSALGSRGIRNEARTEISGGVINIKTTGDCKIETIDGITDTTSCAGIKSDSLFTMTAGTVTISSTGDGGKGINCSQNIEISGGNINVSTTGGKKLSKPKAVKSDTGIILRGGSFHATSKKSWACDNGYEENDAEDDEEIAKKRVTVIGSPTLPIITKREVKVTF